MNKVIINEADPDTYIVSKLNGKKMTRITWKHLKPFGHTTESYCEKFGLTRQDIVCKKLREKLSWTKKACISMYGREDGEKRWKAYCDKQAKTNTFEYKKTKYGMTEDEYREFNLSRACTKENFVKRHGEVIGIKKWEAYCLLQAHAGTSVEYFKEKYGDKHGQEVYDDICRRKSNTLETFIERYGKTEGLKRHQSYMDNKVAFHSEMSQKLFREISAISDCLSGVYYATHQKEYSVYDATCSKIHFYDYVDTGRGRCIEFHGDCFHGNPGMYKSTDTPNPFVRNLTVKEMWELDEIKKDCIIRERGYRFLAVWESDWVNNRKLVIEQCKKFLYE